MYSCVSRKISHFFQQEGKANRIFVECPGPSTGVQHRLSTQLCLKHKQIKFWFQNRSNFTKVTWLEHVSIDGLNAVPQLYRNAVLSGLAFGARRWINTLQGMAECHCSFEDQNLHPAYELENEASWVQFTRVGIIKLFVRNAKSFCSRLSMCSKLNHLQPTLINSRDIQVAIVKNTEPEEPAGHVISAAKSLWLPLVPRAVFDSLCNTEKQHKVVFAPPPSVCLWDILCSEGARRITKVPTGRLLENNISIVTPIVQPFLHVGKLIIRESSIDALGALIVYGQTDYRGLRTLCTPLKNSGLSLLCPASPSPLLETRIKALVVARDQAGSC